jgi:hypothetical protein
MEMELCTTRVGISMLQTIATLFGTALKLLLVDFCLRAHSKWCVAGLPSCCLLLCHGHAGGAFPGAAGNQGAASHSRAGLDAELPSTSQQGVTAATAQATSSVRGKR